MARNRLLTKLTSVHARSKGAPSRNVALNLWKINDVAYLRETAAIWNDRITAPTFNWVAIFNFNARADVEAFAIQATAARLPFLPNSAEALMTVRVGHVVRCDEAPRQPIVYVSFIEVAPWNRAGWNPVERLPGMGTAMLRAASDLAMQLGYRGRVGLHSVSAAEGFYRRLGFEGLDCPNEYNEMYFELSEAGAEALLKD